MKWNHAKNSFHKKLNSFQGKWQSENFYEIMNRWVEVTRETFPMIKYCHNTKLKLQRVQITFLQRFKKIEKLSEQSQQYFTFLTLSIVWKIFKENTSKNWINGCQFEILYQWKLKGWLNYMKRFSTTFTEDSKSLHFNNENVS